MEQTKLRDIDVVEWSSTSRPKLIDGLCCGIAEFKGLYRPMDYVYQCRECKDIYVCHKRTMNVLRARKQPVGV